MPAVFDAFFHFFFCGHDHEVEDGIGIHELIDNCLVLQHTGFNET